MLKELRQTQALASIFDYRTSRLTPLGRMPRAIATKWRRGLSNDKYWKNKGILSIGEIAPESWISGKLIKMKLGSLAADSEPELPA